MCIGSPPLSDKFQPSLPARGATVKPLSTKIIVAISTLAPREGSDQAHPKSLVWSPNFNPRSPRGERRNFVSGPAKLKIFQPSLPARGATVCGGMLASRSSAFQPSLPARGATWICFSIYRRFDISTLAPREGSDS